MFNKLKNFVRVDGLLHLLVCYCLIVTAALVPGGLLAGIIVAVAASLFKESYDITVKKNPKKDSVHDLICDAVGVLLGIGVSLLLM